MTSAEKTIENLQDSHILQNIDIESHKMNIKN